MSELSLAPQGEQQPKPDIENPVNLTSRRDFLKLAAILTGSTFLALNRFGTFEEIKFSSSLVLPQIPDNFKRFVITKPGPRAEQGDLIITAYGSQCPDLSCALLWLDRPDFQFYNSVVDIQDLYIEDGVSNLIWLD